MPQFWCGFKVQFDVVVERLVFGRDGGTLMDSMWVATQPVH